MSTYTGKAVTLPRPVEEIYAKVADLTQYKDLVENLPEEQKAKLNGVRFQDDAICMDAPAIGQLKLRISERVPRERVGFTAEGSPIPLNLTISLRPEGDAQTVVTPAVALEVPAMLRPFIGNKVQEAADKFGEVFTSLFR